MLIAAVLIGLLIIANWWQTNRELDSLLDKVEKSESTMTEANKDIKATLATIDTEPPFNVELNRAIGAKAQEQARHAAADLAVTRAEIEDIRVLPWHGNLLEAAEAYAAHSKAWEAYFTKVGTTDLAAVMNESSRLYLDIETTWKVAEARFEEAVPPFALNDSEERVDDVFDD